MKGALHPEFVAEEGEEEKLAAPLKIPPPKATPCVTKESMRGFAGELDLDLRVSLFCLLLRDSHGVGYGFCRNHLQADL